MTPQEFCAWLEGYLIGAGSNNIDADVIKAKAREIAAPASVPQPLQPSAPGVWWPSPTVPQYPTWPIITCSTNGASDCFEVVDYPPWTTENCESGLN